MGVDHPAHRDAAPSYSCPYLFTFHYRDMDMERQSQDIRDRHQSIKCSCPPLDPLEYPRTQRREQDIVLQARTIQELADVFNRGNVVIDEGQFVHTIPGDIEEENYQRRTAEIYSRKVKKYETIGIVVCL